jgi:hypothetical protein
LDWLSVIVPMRISAASAVTTSLRFEGCAPQFPAAYGSRQ